MNSDRIGHYQLLEHIGAGGMAEVFTARPAGGDTTQPIVAIKRIRSDLAADPQFVALFMEEAHLAARLRHPNIARVFEYGESEGVCFIAMEYIKGGDLRHVLNDPGGLGVALPLPHAIEIICAMCDALDYAHGLEDASGRPLNLVHCDLSPQNVLISCDGSVKLIDFGIARARTRSALRSKQVAGIYAYMSPEQVAGEKLDRRSDIFVLGSLLYECALGRRAFESTTPVGVMEKVRTCHFVQPRQLDRSFPEPLDRIVRGALTRDPADRYQTASAMKADLERCLEELTGEPDRHRATKELATLVSASESTAQPVQDERKQDSDSPTTPRRARRWWFVVAIVVTSCVAYGFVTRHSFDHQQRTISSHAKRHFSSELEVSGH